MFKLIRLLKFNPTKLANWLFFTSYILYKNAKYTHTHIIHTYVCKLIK